MSGAPLAGLEKIFGGLLTASWQASVLAVLVLGLQWTLGARLNPRWRYALWLLVLVRLLLPFQVESAFSLFQFAPAPSASLEGPMTQPFFSAAPSPAAFLPIPVAAAPPLIALSPYAMMALAWLAGVAILGVLTFEVNRRFARQVAASPEVTDPVIRALFAEAKAEFQTRRAVRLVESAQVGSPAIMGLFRPTLLLPTRVREMFDPAELRLIFLHELAHLKRGDVIAQGLIALLQILHWFNPVLGFAFRRMRADREPAADALVLSRAGEGEKERYGLMLLKLLEHFHQRHALPTLVGILEDKDPLKRRFQLIARFTRGAYGWSMLGAAILAVTAVTGLTKAKAAAPARGIELMYQVDGKPVTLSAEAQERIRPEMEAIVRSLNFTSDRHPGYFPPKARIAPAQIEREGSYLRVRYPVEQTFVTQEKPRQVRAQEIYEGFKDNPKGGSYPGIPGGRCLVTAQGHVIYFSMESGVLVTRLGIDPDIYPHLPPRMKKQLEDAKNKMSMKPVVTSDSRIDPGARLLPRFSLEKPPVLKVGAGTTSLADSPARPPNDGVANTDLSGTVQDEKGQPISGATVQIYTAGMRSGSSPTCPSCWPDCAKNVKSDSQGSFQIKNVSGQLVFRLLIIATGFEPAFLEADPQKGVAQVRLKARDLGAFHDKQIIQGVVVGPDLKPVAGAIVTTEFNQEGLDPVAVTDEAGKFIFTCAHDITKNYLTFRAPGYAPRMLLDVVGGSAPLQITLTHGVVVSGRVLDQGLPVAGIGLGIAQTERERGVNKWLGPQTTVTDANGAFHFYAAIPHATLVLYGLMSSLAGKGAIPVRVIQTGADDSTLLVGDLAIVPGGEIKGRLRETDGKPFPPETRIGIGRDAAWDQQLVDVDADGSFHAADFPLGEKLSVWAPRDHQIQKVNSEFEIDPLNSRVTGTFSRALPDLEIDLVAKDERSQQAERDIQQANENYGAFFAQERFTPDQVKLFVADQLEQRRVYVKASEGGSSYSQGQRQGNEAMQKLLTDKFGAKVCGDYVDFENLREGLIVVSWFYTPPQDSWLTEDEKEKLARVLWPVEEEAEAAGDLKKLTKEQKIVEANYFIGRFQTEGEKVLPQAKHAAYEKALAKFKEGLLQLENDNN
jgi:beta-lactamase regulating signal transducer with metallopeptidase domain